MFRKEEFLIFEFILGIECGGFDLISGLVVNLLIGELSDKFVDLGVILILSEIIEFIGVEYILVRRVVNEEVKEKILYIVYRYENLLKLVGEEVREGNLFFGNIVGGLISLEEKLFGCIYKGGYR